MAPLLIELGKAYVVNFDRRALHQAGLKIALCVGRAKGGDVLMKVRRGSQFIGGWARETWRVSSTAVRREASKREVAINFVVDPVPAAAS